MLLQALAYHAGLDGLRESLSDISYFLKSLLLSSEAADEAIAVVKVSNEVLLHDGIFLSKRLVYPTMKWTVLAK